MFTVSCSRKLGYLEQRQLEKTVYVPKPYDTPTELGAKWQLDVKFVPKECYVGEIPDKFYQSIYCC